MASDRCPLPPEDLLAYADGELRGDHRARVEAALAASPACRRRFAALGATGRLLRDASPLADDPAGRAAVRARLERASPRSAMPRLGGIAAVVALPLVLLLALMTTEQSFLWDSLLTVRDAAVDAETGPTDRFSEARITARVGVRRPVAIPCLVQAMAQVAPYGVRPSIAGQRGPGGASPACASQFSARGDRTAWAPAVAPTGWSRQPDATFGLHAPYGVAAVQHTARATLGLNRPGCAAVQPFGLPVLPRNGLACT